MSTKGLSVTASRHLVDELCGEHRIPLLVVHDLDKAGFSIVGTLQRDTRRYEFAHVIDVIDLGLRLEDVEAYGLQAEGVSYSLTDPTSNLRTNGATDEEIDFLCGDGYRGKRVELNALTSGDMIKWIESKLNEHGIKKIVPEEETLKAAYLRAFKDKKLRGVIEEATDNINRESETLDCPNDLEERVREILRNDPAMTWDAAIEELVPEPEDVN